MESIIQILRDELTGPIDIEEQIENIFCEGNALQSWLSSEEVDLISSVVKLINIPTNEMSSNVVDMDLKLMNPSIGFERPCLSTIGESPNVADINHDVQAKTEKDSTISLEDHQLVYNEQTKHFDIERKKLDIIKNMGEKIDQYRQSREKCALMQFEKTTELTKALNTETEVLREIYNHLKRILD